tara:strand:- start:165 stop:572 length:408 start_codon:yes stop_codon:yes gene_type:complete
MLRSKKNISLGKIKLYLVLLILLSINNVIAKDQKDYQGNFVEIKILDKLSSKNTTLNIEINHEKIFKNITIKALKCKNSKFDDDPEVTAYLQVKDLKKNNNDKVFIFNGWTFSSSPSIQTFDHPVYDLWLTRCYN